MENNPIFTIGTLTGSTVMGTYNIPMHSNTVLIGSNLTSEEDGEIILGNGNTCLRLKSNGDLYWRGDKIEELNNELIIEFNNLFREIIKECLNTKNHEKE